jgi:hypothetical protein
MRSKNILVFLSVLFCQNVLAQTSDPINRTYSISGYRYWFDQSTAVHTGAYSRGTVSLDARGLEEGFHALHLQVVDNTGEVSPTRTSFFKLITSDEAFKSYAIKTVRYWFDMNYAPKEVAYSGGSSIIQVDNLLEGFHTLHYQVVDDKGEVSPTRTSFFRLLTSAPTNNEVVGVRYWTEQDENNVKTADFVGGTSILDLSQTTEGTHTLFYQVFADNGMISSVGVSPFERYIYDIYISETTEYADSTIRNNSLLSSVPDLKLHYRTDDVAVRGHLTVNEGANLSLGKFVQTANWGCRNNSDKYAQGGSDYYHPTTLINEGVMHADSVIVKQRLYRDRWHFISLPFNTKVEDIRVADGTSQQ